MKSIFEQNGGTYHLEGDYLIPDLILPEEPEISKIDFDAYALEADRKNSIIAGLIEDNLLLLKEAQDKLNTARHMLPAMSAIDDPDMDPKNIMWNEDKAYVIDLECLERGNPIATCLDLALQWAGTVNGRYSKENLAAIAKSADEARSGKVSEKSLADLEAMEK